METNKTSCDEVKFDWQKNAFLENQQVLNKIAGLYEDLEIGDITPERIKYILIDNNYVEIIAASRENLRNKLSNKLSYQNIERKIEEIIKNFKDKIGNFKHDFGDNQRAVSTPIEYYTIVNGRFCLTEDTWTRIRDERCSIVVETEQELKIYNAIQDIAAATTEFLAAMGPETRAKILPELLDASFLMYIEGSFVPNSKNDYKTLSK